MDGRDIARLVVLEANLVPQPVREVLPPAGALYHGACGAVYLGKRDARSYDGLGRLVCPTNALVDGPLVLGGRAVEERARHVRAVHVLAAAHVEENHVTLGKNGAVGGVMRVRRVCPKAHDGRKGVVLRTKRPVDVEKAAGNLLLGHALVNLGAKPLHGLIVRARRRAHKALLLRRLYGASIVNGGGAQLERGGGACLLKRHKPARGKLLVHAERRVVVRDSRDQRHGFLGVIEGADVLARRRGVREEAVGKERRGSACAEVESQEALVGLGVVAREVVNRHGVRNQCLRKPHTTQVLDDLRPSHLVHCVLLSR